MSNFFLFSLLVFQIFVQMFSYSVSSFLFLFLSFELIFYSSLVFMLSCSPFFKFNKKSLLLFFLAKTLGGLAMFLSLSHPHFPEFFFSLGIIFKIGLPPFFWWFPIFISNMSWIGVWWFSSFYKMVYYVFLSSVGGGSLFFLFLSVSLFLLSIFQLSFNRNLKIFMGFSSLVDSCFLIFVSSILGVLFPMLYTFVYSGFLIFLASSAALGSPSPTAVLLVSGFPPSPLFFLKMFSFFSLLSSGVFTLEDKDFVVFPLMFGVVIQSVSWLIVLVKTLFSFLKNFCSFFFFVLLLMSFFLVMYSFSFLCFLLVIELFSFKVLLSFLFSKVSFDHSLFLCFFVVIACETALGLSGVILLKNLCDLPKFRLCLYFGL